MRMVRGNDFMRFDVWFHDIRLKRALVILSVNDLIVAACLIRRLWLKFSCNLEMQIVNFFLRICR